jgi:hypothetical protein
LFLFFAHLRKCYHLLQDSRNQDVMYYAKGIIILIIRSLTPQRAKGNALAAGFKKSIRGKLHNHGSRYKNLKSHCLGN